MGGEAVDVSDTLRLALADRYTIERELGQGGMATVYLAEDLKHHRPVALKVLKPELSAVLGPERFLREIELSARLTHPHILPLHDSGTANGILYYVMPYVEGESLRDRLNREKQLPLDDALQIAREVADGLSYAHARGVVHRDIKPENILLASGHAVVADFGIAKAIAVAGSARLTETGLAIGTPAYMSPEQAAGSEDVDGRSDLYSLGCVLYEMLSGETPYTGPTAQAILAKKLSEPLPRISVVREAVPAGIETALNKALARTPADRWVTAAEFAAVLAHPEALVTPSATRPTRELARLPPWAQWAAGVAALLILALVASLLLTPRPLSVGASDLMQVTNEPGVEFQPAISPDGKEVAYVGGPIGAQHLVIRSAVNVAGGGAVRLADTAFTREWFPAWNPDGEFVRFVGCRKDDCAWYEASRLGGAIRAVTVPRGARLSWSPDGTRIAFVRADTIFTSSATGTDVRRVAADTAKVNDAHSLAWSPDGKWIAYVRGNSRWLVSGNVAISSIWIVSAAGGEPQPVTTADCLNVSPVWLDAQHLLYVSDRDGERAAYAVEVGRRGIRGAPRAVPGVADPHSISYSITAHKLAYAKFTLKQNIWAYPLGRAAPVSIRDGRPVTAGTQVIEYLDVSRDGRWIVYGAYHRGRLQLYKIAASGGQPVPLTNGAHEDDEVPNWSPDGREIAFNVVGAQDSIQLAVMPSEGGAPVPLTAGPATNLNPRWSPDGRQIVFQSNRSGKWRNWILSRDSVDGPWRRPARVADAYFGICADWSPDGSAVLCTGDQLDNLVPVSPRSGRVLRSDLLTASHLPQVFGNYRYSQDGRAIYAGGTGEDRRRGIWVISLAGGPARLVVAYDDPALVGSPWLSVGPDRLYLTVAQYESDIWVANLHW